MPHKRDHEHHGTKYTENGTGHRVRDDGITDEPEINHEYTDSRTQHAIYPTDITFNIHRNIPPAELNLVFFLSLSPILSFLPRFSSKILFFVLLIYALIIIIAMGQAWPAIPQQSGIKSM
jgi:hypothetical protein